MTDRFLDQDKLAGYFEYLDRLRNSGATNMFGAGVYLSTAFDIPRGDSNVVLSAWMKSYKPGVSADERAAAWLGW